jgi:hypothetical protein
MKKLKPGDEVDVSLGDGSRPVRRIVAAIEGEVVRVCTRLEYEAALAQHRTARAVSFSSGLRAAGNHR